MFIQQYFLNTFYQSITMLKHKNKFLILYFDNKAPILFVF